MRRVSGSRWLGLVPLAAFGWVVLAKVREGTLPDLLWACNVSAVAIGAGTLAGLRWPVAVGFLFHAAVGMLAWLLDVSATGTTYGPSVACHSSSFVVGALAARRLGMPAGCAPAAVAYWLLLLVASRLFTPPERNVNLVFAPWDPVAGAWNSAWLSHGANLVAIVLALAVVDHVLRARLGWAAAAAGAGRELRPSVPPASRPRG